MFFTLRALGAVPVEGVSTMDEGGVGNGDKHGSALTPENAISTDFTAIH